MKKTSLLIILLSVIQFVIYAQDVETKQDTIRQIDTLSIKFPLNVNMKTFQSLPELHPSLLSESVSDSNVLKFDSKILLDLKPLEFYTSEKLSIYPVGYRFYNGFEGGELMGVNAAFKLNSFLTGNIGANLNKSFYGYLYPYPIDNGSLSMDVTLHLHERIQLFGFGKVSMREGIDPNLAPVINSGTYYGGGVKIKILKNFGIGLGVSNNYFRKNWTLQPFAFPAFFP